MTKLAPTARQNRIAALLALACRPAGRSDAQRHIRPVFPLDPGLRQPAPCPVAAEAPALRRAA